MDEKQVWTFAGHGRDQGAEMVRDEPSHIHLPRRRRRGQPDDQGNRTPWNPEKRPGGSQPPVIQT